MYKIYLDKQENFECEVSVKNASLKNSVARLVLESDTINLVFNGTIENGKCTIPINRLRGLLEENTKGKLNLEVIVEDTYFKPWKSEFIVEEFTSVKVKVNEQKQSSTKPMIEVKSVKNPNRSVKPSVNLLVPRREIAKICEQFSIKKSNFSKKRKEFSQILKEYFSVNTEYKNHIPQILKGIEPFIL